MDWQRWLLGFTAGGCWVVWTGDGCYNKLLLVGLQLFACFGGGVLRVVGLFGGVRLWV